MMRFTYKHTMFASYIGYVTQATVNNLAPLLFVTFQKEFDISLQKIGYIIIINFFVQILTDITAARFADKIGYRTCVCGAHILAFTGLFGLGIFPYMFHDAYLGILIATVISAVGGGLLEVVVSPIVEALPGDAKSSKMSFLHSFYCWGQMAVALISTAYFAVFGTWHWRFLCYIWALIPLFNMFIFLKVPLCKLVSKEDKMPFKVLAKNKLFWVFLILMLSSGASELAMSQWSSLFAEAGLKVSKAFGDLLGLCMFAFLMGIARVYFSLAGNKIKIENGLLFSSILCIASYLLTAFAKNPVLSLIGCAMCGLSVGLMWPGTYSLASKFFQTAGTAMFAVLAFAGDIGCLTGPAIVGSVSTFIQKMGDNILPFITGADATETGLKTGLAIVSLFPVMMFLSVIFLKKKEKSLGR